MFKNMLIRVKNGLKGSLIWQIEGKPRVFHLLNKTDISSSCSKTCQQLLIVWMR